MHMIHSADGVARTPAATTTRSCHCPAATSMMVLTSPIGRCVPHMWFVDVTASRKTLRCIRVRGVCKVSSNRAPRPVGNRHSCEPDPAPARPAGMPGLLQPSIHHSSEQERRVEASNAIIPQLLGAILKRADQRRHLGSFRNASRRRSSDQYSPRLVGQDWQS